MPDGWKPETCLAAAPELQPLMAVTYKGALSSRSHAEFGSEVELGSASV